jgi:GNAT superfamily N-acetyltransferase
MFDSSAIEVSADPSRIDLPLVCDFLGQSYWAKHVPRELVEQSIRNSLCFGAYLNGQQIAFARVITDRALVAYLADVFVLPEYRRCGVAKALMRNVLDHPELKTARVFLLRTRDAHGLYKRFGFGPVPRPEELMGRYVLKGTP